MNVESCEEEIKKKLEYLGSLQWLTKNSLTDLMNMATNTLQQTTFLPMAGYEIKKRIVHCQELKPEEYTAIVNKMYMFKLFDRCQSVFWCENCRDASQIYSSVSMIDPYHVNMHCLKCQRPMCTAIAYHPIDALLKCINFKDGILAIYLGHLLREKQIIFRHSVYTKFENDFICTTDSGTVLIECGMHRTDVEERGLKNILEKDADQLIRHAKTLKEEGNDVVFSVALSNYKSPKIEKVVAQMNKSTKYSKLIKEYNIRIVGFDQIINVLDEMKGS